MNTAPGTLDELVDTYNIDTVTEQYKRLEFLEKLSSHVQLNEAAVLELGSASGRLTELLADRCSRVVAVDGSARFLALAKARPGNQRVTFVHSRFESLALSDIFQVVVLHHVLEHVERPAQLLESMRSLLAPNGVLAITVPNAHALSRQLAVKMGLLGTVFDLTENDHHHGHYRVYDSQSLEDELRQSKYEIAAAHGLAFKLFADFQNEKIVEAGIIGDKQLRGLWDIADEHRGIAGAIMVIAEPMIS